MFRNPISFQIPNNIPEIQSIMEVFQKELDKYKLFVSDAQSQRDTKLVLGYAADLGLYIYLI